MNEVELIMLKDGEGCTIYTLQYINDDENEFEKFVNKVKEDSSLDSDFRQIIRILERISNVGAMERYFRPEGKYNDSVGAIPVIKSKLRLYCIRFSDKILILGNGGVKNTRTYNEDYSLQGYVITLQKFEQILKDEEKRGNVEITEKHIITDQIFKL